MRPPRLQLPSFLCPRLRPTTYPPFLSPIPPAFTPHQSRPKSLKARDLPPKPVIPETEFTEVFLKGSGPGGQKINKTNSAVQLSHLPTGIVVKCQATRSREQNRKIARQILAMKVDEHFNGDNAREKLKESIRGRKKGSGAKKRRRKYRRLAEGAQDGEDGEEEEYDTGDEDDEAEGEEDESGDEVESANKDDKPKPKPKHNTPTKADKFTAPLPSDFSRFVTHHPEEFDLFQNPVELGEPETIEEYCVYLQRQFRAAKERNPDAFEKGEGANEPTTTERSWKELSKKPEVRRELMGLWADYQDRLTRTCSNVPPRRAGGEES